MQRNIQSKTERKKNNWTFSLTPDWVSTRFTDL